MPRKSRIQSGTGVYHVMMHGINRQRIFEDTEDHYTFLQCRSNAQEKYSPEGERLPNSCHYYAYTLRSELVETPLGEHVSCLEYEDERSRSMSDDQVMLYLFEELASVPLSQDFNGRQAVLSIGVFGYS